MKGLERFSPALVLFVALGFVGTAVAQDVVSGPARVIDGDTIAIRGQRIRMHGIDAPESAQTCLDASGQAYRCGQVASNALASMAGRGSVACRARDVDRYGRLIAVCFRDGIDLNAWMVRDGYAMAYRRYSSDYVRHESAARARRAGIWQGRFVAPWDWRRTQGAGNSGAPARREGCAIKGNVSSSGERIYHVPGQSRYDATRISEAKGERWFCSEAEARAAGWRRARR
ncbi:MAG: thermonuclease family protein [Boseongicola sp. SB0677_bin_26]|nr:thermonuclease family protein [Boseongicola sp. SB0677_bin_26]